MKHGLSVSKDLFGVLSSSLGLFSFCCDDNEDALSFNWKGTWKKITKYSLMSIPLFTSVLSLVITCLPEENKAEQ